MKSLIDGRDIVATFNPCGCSTGGKKNFGSRLTRLAPAGSEQVGKRLDIFLARELSGARPNGELSRSGIQKVIVEGHVTLNGKRTKPGARIKLGDLIEVRWQPPRETGLEPEPLRLEILYEDEDCIVLNKTPGMVVHPAAGRWSGTLVNALLYHCPNLRGIGGERRPGIVHRLDKDTSGVMVVAKREEAFHRIAHQFKERQVCKEYLALVWGRVEPKQGVIDRPVGRHRADRKRMSSLYSLAPTKREATTQWQVKDCFRVGLLQNRYCWVSFVRLKPQTGRTHQIRVHLADQGYPVVGDRMYGPKRAELLRSGIGVSALVEFPRQALHAEKLEFSHPRTGTRVEFRASLPEDMQRMVDLLRKESSAFEGKKLEIRG